MSPPAEKARSPAAADHHARDRRIVAPRRRAARATRAPSMGDGVERLRPVEGDETGGAAPLEQDFRSDIGRVQLPSMCAADDQSHDLVGAFQDLVHAHVAQHALDRMIAQIAVTAMQLQAAIDHLEAGIGGKPLGLRGKPRGGGLALARPPPRRDAAAGARLRSRSRNRRCGTAAPGNRPAASRTACALSCSRWCGRGRTARRRASRRRCSAARRRARPWRS